MLVPKDAGVGLLLWGQHHGWDRVPRLTAEWDDAWSAVFASLHPDLTDEALKHYIQIAILNCTPAAKASRAAH